MSYAGSPHPGLPLVVGAGGPILIGEGGAIRPETVWACTTCRACVVSCPMMIEHLDGIFELRRFETLERGTTPGKAPEVLRHLAETDTQCGRSTAERLDFAADLSLPLLEEGKSTEVLLWIGEGGYELRNQRSLRAFIELLRVADVDFAVLPEELDCGDLARRLGDEIEFDRLARANIRALSRLTFRTIVTMDPHIAHSFVRDYPALGGLYEVMHHSRFLVTLISQGRLSLARRMEGRLTYHDPCYLGRYLDEVEAPRRLLDHVTDERLEMTRHGRSSFCCGGGGGAAVTDIRGGRRIPDVRMDQARETGAEMVVVACPTCTIMLEGVSHPRPHVRELSEVLLDALGPAVL